MAVGLSGSGLGGCFSRLSASTTSADVETLTYSRASGQYHSVPSIKVPMSLETDTAIKCFTENRDLFANATLEPEKFNLYNGMSALSKAIEGVETQLLSIRRDIENLQRKLR